MNAYSRITMRHGTAAAAAMALLLAGSAVTYLAVRGRLAANADGARPEAIPTVTPAAKSAPGASAVATHGPLPDVVVPLNQDALQRAGITVEEVKTGTLTADARLPGVVEPNAYRQVTVTPLAAGRITRVAVELGARVRRGQTIAEIYSPALAEAQTRYVSARAMLDAHDRELRRTEKLVAIGAASRQELERIHAEHAAQQATVKSARSQVELLGGPTSALDREWSGQDITAMIRVPAPIDGTVTERIANVGLNVDPATKLFTVVDLSTVWIVADVYEKDLARVAEGAEAAITTAAYPGQVFRGRISYIDPQVRLDTRTARVRVEVANRSAELRLGMYVDVVVTSAPPGPQLPVIPTSAVQNVADRTVVYLVDRREAGRFIERQVRLGRSSGQQVEVTSGLAAGDSVVANGSFVIRAERERLGLRPAMDLATARQSDAAVENRGGSGDTKEVRILVNERGFEPAIVNARADTRLRLEFLRTTDKTCATEVVVPSMNVKRVLPLNEPVAIEVTVPKAGRIAFTCGMNMFQGAIVSE